MDFGEVAAVEDDHSAVRMQLKRLAGGDKRQPHIGYRWRWHGLTGLTGLEGDGELLDVDLGHWLIPSDYGDGLAREAGERF